MLLLFSCTGGRTITKTKKVNSFFGFFSPPKLPQGDEDEEEDEDEEGGVHEQLEEDLELSLFIRDRIIPHATDYFLHNETTMDVDEVCAVCLWGFLFAFCISS